MAHGTAESVAPTNLLDLPRSETDRASSKLIEASRRNHIKTDRIPIGAGEKTHETRPGRLRVVVAGQDQTSVGLGVQRGDDVLKVLAGKKKKQKQQAIDL